MIIFGSKIFVFGLCLLWIQYLNLHSPQQGEEFPRSFVHLIPIRGLLNVGEGKEGMVWKFLRLADQGESRQILGAGLHHKLQTDRTL